MPLTSEKHDDHSLIRVDGDFTLTLAAELKAELLDGLASATELRLDLEKATEIDITLMQLLWAAGREADRAGSRIVIRVSDAAAAAANAAGFVRFPGVSRQE